MVQVGASILSWEAIQSIPRLFQEVTQSLKKYGQDRGFFGLDWSHLRQAEWDELAAVEEVDKHRETSILDITSNNTTYSSIELGKILLQSSRLNATDPRDFVYGVLSMSNANFQADGNQFTSVKQPQAVLRIDYSRSVSQVFQDVTRYLICRDRRLDVLLVGWCLRPKDDLDIASWTPDWRIGHRPRWLDGFRVVRKELPNAIDRGTPWRRRGGHSDFEEFIPSADSLFTPTNVLCVDGATCGTIFNATTLQPYCGQMPKSSWTSATTPIILSQNQLASRY